MEEQNVSGGIKDLSLPLGKASVWMLISGIITIIGGAFMVIATLGIGILFAWFPIWMGILLIMAAGAAKKAHVNNSTADFLNALNKLKTYFMVSGIVSLIGIGLSIIFSIFGLTAALTGGLISGLNMQ